MMIAQITDMHLVPEGQLSYGVAPMAKNLAACVKWINEMAPRPDLVLVTGDLTDRGDGPSTALAARLLGQLAMPFFVVPGNHDDPEVIWEQFGGSACPRRTGAGMDFVIEGWPLRLIGMDSTRKGHPGGELNARQLEWLDGQLGRMAKEDVLLFMHHPPLKLGLAETDVDGFSGADDLGRVIARHGNVRRIACGHVHLPIVAAWHETVVCTAPGCGMELVADLTMKAPSAFHLAAPSVQLHYQGSDGTLASLTQYVGDRAGPHRF